MKLSDVVSFALASCIAIAPILIAVALVFLMSSCGMSAMAEAIKQDRASVRVHQCIHDERPAPDGGSHKEVTCREWKEQK